MRPLPVATSACAPTPRGSEFSRQRRQNLRLRPHDLVVSAALLAEHHSKVSIGLLAAIASGHRQGVPLAKAAGLAVEHFPEEEDIRAIWYALDEAAAQGLDRSGAARMCCKVLVGFPCWRPEGAISLWGETWNVESVALLFGVYPAPGAAVPALASKLIDLSHQLRRIRRLAHALDRAVAQSVDRLHPREAVMRAA